MPESNYYELNLPNQTIVTVSLLNVQNPSKIFTFVESWLFVLTFQCCPIAEVVSSIRAGLKNLFFPSVKTFIYFKIKKGFETKPIEKVGYSQPNVKINVKDNGDEQISSKYILLVVKQIQQSIN